MLRKVASLNRHRIRSSHLGGQELPFYLLHLVHEVFGLFSQCQLRFRKHLAFFFFHMVFDVFHQFVEFGIKHLII